MANFEVTIAEHEFANLGIEVGFDRDSYGELLGNELCYPDDSLTVHVAPISAWTILMKRGVAPLGPRLSVPLSTAPRGYYSASHLTLQCGPDIAKTNNQLLRATKLYLDEQNGENQPQPTEDDINYPLSGAAAIATGTFAVLAARMDVGSAMVFSAFAGFVTSEGLQYLDKTFDESARAARDFANQPQIQEEFGSVVSYHYIP